MNTSDVFETIACCAPLTLLDASEGRSGFGGLDQAVLVHGASAILRGHSPLYPCDMYRSPSSDSLLDAQSCPHRSLFPCVFEAPRCQGVSCESYRVRGHVGGVALSSIPAYEFVGHYARVFLRARPHVEAEITTIKELVGPHDISLHLQEGDKTRGVPYYSALIDRISDTDSSVFVATDDDCFLRNLANERPNTTMIQLRRRPRVPSSICASPSNIRHVVSSFSCNADHLYAVQRMLAATTSHFILNSQSNFASSAVAMSAPRVLTLHDITGVLRTEDLARGRWFCLDNIATSGIAPLRRSGPLCDHLFVNDRPMLQFPTHACIALLTMVVTWAVIRHRRRIPKHVPPLVQLVGTVLLFSVASCSLTILNKVVSASYDIPLLVLSLQMAVSCVFVTAAQDSVKFNSGWTKWLVSVSPLFVIQLSTSMLALQRISIGSYVVTRNLTPCVTVIMERASFGRRVSMLEYTSATIIFCSAVMYEYDNVKFSAVGAVLLGVNLVSSCLERVVQKYWLTVKQINLSHSSIVLLNNSMFPVVVLMHLLFKPEQTQWISKYVIVLLSETYVYVVAASCLVGTVLAYVAIHLQVIVEASSFFALTCLNKILVIGFGMLVYGDSCTPLGVCGIMLGIIACFTFGCVPKDPSVPDMVRLKVET